MNRSSMYYGWKPDLPDHRDLQFSALAATLKKLPPKIDLRASCPEVYNQGQLGSCTGNAIAAAFQFDLIKQKVASFIPSRLFIYYNERVIENTVKFDSGAQIRDGIKTIAGQGVCPETMWPYEISEFSVKPFAACYIAALKHKAVTYERVQRDLNQMKSCLAEGEPFIIGFTVYNSFESKDVETTGVMDLPKPGEWVVGGHAVLVVGYDDANKRFMVRNSWGEKWGMKGYFTMPYDYLLNPGLSSDFWTIKTISANLALTEAANTEPAVSTINAEAVQSVTATLTVQFTNTNPGVSKLVATHKGIMQTITQSGSISFDNVSSGERIQIDGKSLGNTHITVDVKALPQAMDFPPGFINGQILIL